MLVPVLGDFVNVPPSAGSTIDATSVISPQVRMLPNWIVVTGDSLSSAGSQYFPAAFRVVSPNVNTNGDGFDSYHIVYSYTGGTPQTYEVGSGTKPLTSWAEQFIATSGASTNLINTAYAGRSLQDMRQFYWQEAHLVAPRLDGVPKAFAIWGGTNDAGGGRTGSQMWGDIQDLIAYARADGYYPIIVCTILPSTFQNAGSTFDTNRLSLNTLINASTASAGGPDIIADLNTVSEVAATNSPTSGNPYTHNASYYYDGTHPNAAGNAKIAAYTFSQMKAFAGDVTSQTQRTVSSFSDFSFQLLAPFRRRTLLVSDLQASNSGGDVYTGEGVAGGIGIRNGAANTNYSKGFWYVEFLGDHFGWNGSYSAKGRDRIDWGRPQMLEFAIQPDWGNSGNSWPHTKWQVVCGRANGFTPGPLANGDYAFGIQIDASTAGQFTIKAVAANGSVATTSATLATILDNGGSFSQTNIQAYTDGIGNLVVNINGAKTVLLESSIHAPAMVESGNNQVSYEAYTTGTEANNSYLYLSVPAFSTW